MSLTNTKAYIAMKDILKVQYGLYKVLGELVTDISYADGLFNGIYIP